MIFIFDEYRLDLDRRELSRAGDPVAVEPRVFDLLAYLVRNREKVASKDELIAAVWNGRIVSDSALASCINAARAMLGDDGERQRLIKTLPRKGVRFVGTVRDELSAAPAMTNSVALALPDRPSIAVLPFQNMSSDPEQEYFADGMVEDIISGLARINWLFVIARNSSFIYKGRAVDLRQVGRELGVRHLLQGGVRKAGDRIRISAQLIDAETGAHVWVERYDRTLRDIFALQDEIAMNVIGAIEPALRHEGAMRAGRQRPRSLDAYDLVLRAAPFAYSHLADEAAIAIPLLQKAIELEPGYAGAHAPLALCHHARYSRAGLREENRIAAIRHAQTAVESGGEDPSVLGIAGFVMSLDAHDHDMALDLFDRALRLSDTNFFTLSSSALVLSWLGKTTTALERSARALRLSPFDRLNYLSLNAQAISYFHLRQFDRAHDAATRSVELNPRFSVSHAFLAAVLAELGRDAEARAEAARVLVLDPTFSVDRFLVTVGIEDRVFRPLVTAWRAAGLP